MSILSGLSKTFKSVVSSPSKLLLASAAVYLGGSAFGWWDSPIESINGVWKGEDAGLTGTGSSDASSLASAERMPSGSTSSELINHLQGGSLDPFEVDGGARAYGNGDAVARAMGGAPKVDPYEVDGGASAYGGTMNPPQAKQGLISTVTGKAMDYLGATGKFIKENPVPSMIIGNTLAQAGTAMMQPNAIDVLKERQRIEREDSDRRRQIANTNLAVGGVNLGLPRHGIISNVRKV